MRHEQLGVTELKARKVIGEFLGENAVWCLKGVINYNVADPFTVTLGMVPKGARILETVTDVETVFNAVTTNVLTVGGNATFDDLVAAGDVNEASATVQRKSSRLVMTADTLIKAKYTQTGTAATTGKAHIVVYYTK